MKSGKRLTYNERRLIHSEFIEFSNIVLYKDRALDSHEFLTRLDKYIGSHISLLPQGTDFYRARQYSITDTSYYKKYHPNALYYMPDEAKKRKSETSEQIKLYKEAKEKQQRNEFWGFSDLESLCPPLKLRTEGRLNPQYIQILYTSRDAYTAIMETRPFRGMEVSLAILNNLVDLRLADLTFPISDTPDERMMGYVLYKLFSSSMSDGSDYIVSQVVANHIRKTKYDNLSLDGIRYSSSQSPKGENYALFSQRKFKVVKTQIYFISDMLMECQCTSPDKTADIVNSTEINLELIKQRKSFSDFMEIAFETDEMPSS